MTVLSCPTDVIAAPVETVWALLTRSERYDLWTGAQLVSADPGGPARPGQRIEFRVRALARAWRVRFEVGELRDRETLELDVYMPFGIVNHELVVLSRLDPSNTRVTFN